MITVQYKEGNEWKTDDNTFATLDIAKAYTVKQGYGQYKVWNDTTLLAPVSYTHLTLPTIYSV